jgi:general secretion pathway protein M
MALTLPDGPRGRALALGITAILLAAVWLAVGQPLLDAYADRADQLQRRGVLAARMADLAASLPELRREAETVATDATPATATLAGATDALAGAALQGLVEGMTNAAGGHLTSTEALPAEQVGAYRRVALRLTVDASWPVVVHMMQAIERATPRMFIDDLQIHAQPAAEKLREPPLDIAFTVLAFRAATADVQPAAPAAPDAAAPQVLAPDAAAADTGAPDAAAAAIASPPVVLTPDAASPFTRRPGPPR